MRSSNLAIRVALVAAVSLAFLTAVGCSTNRSVGEQLDDAAISSKIETKLAGDPQVSAFAVDVDTVDGVVRLSGTVGDETAKREAEELAEDTEGVVRVINEIEIGERSFGERLDDAGIVARIKAKLTGDPQVNALNVDVDSKDGVVTLSGHVEEADAKREAEELARDTEGVREVRNRIEVVGEGS